MSSSTEAEGETGPIFNFHSIVFQLVFIFFPLLNHFHERSPFTKQQQDKQSKSLVNFVINFSNHLLTW